MATARPPAQVLVVDDEPSIRELLKDILEEEACCAATAPHGAAALEYLAQTPTPPKVILLDVRMPIMDGITFLRIKEADPAIKDIPVVLLSAHLQHQPEVLALSVTAFLPKPVSYDLIAAIARRYCHATSEGSRRSARLAGAGDPAAEAREGHASDT